jgi:hypothetical protein
VALHYINTADIFGLLDAKVYQDTFNLAAATRLCSEAEMFFDNSQRFQWEVPFTQALHPDSYALAQEVCKRQAAAQYILWSMQAEGTPDQAWYAKELQDQAEATLELFNTRRLPEDAVQNAEGRVYAPDDGLGTTELTAHEPIFRRDHLTSGSSSHW